MWSAKPDCAYSSGSLFGVERLSCVRNGRGNLCYASETKVRTTPLCRQLASKAWRGFCQAHVFELGVDLDGGVNM